MKARHPIEYARHLSAVRRERRPAWYLRALANNRDERRRANLDRIAARVRTVQAVQEVASVVIVEAAVSPPFPHPKRRGPRRWLPKVDPDAAWLYRQTPEYKALFSPRRQPIFAPKVIRPKPVYPGGPLAVDYGEIIPIFEATQEQDQATFQLREAIAKLAPAESQFLTAIMEGATVEEAAHESDFDLDLLPRIREYLRSFLK